MTLTLDPPVSLWSSLDEPKEGQALSTGYRSGEYRLTVNEKKRGEKIRVFEYEIKRADGKPFKVVDNIIECKTNYSGVYKMFNPMTMAQQNYKIDLPFRLEGACSGLTDIPVVWMQQTDGHNTLTIGMLDQLPATGFSGSSLRYLQWRRGRPGLPTVTSAPR